MTDERMPQMTGTELLKRSQGECPEAIRIVFTGYADIKAVVDAINHGQIYRYLTKPWDPDELVSVLHQACEHYDRLAERRRLLRDLRDHVARCDGLLDGLLDGLPGGAPESAKRDAAALLERIDRALAPEPPAGGT